VRAPIEEHIVAVTGSSATRIVRQKTISANKKIGVSRKTKAATLSLVVEDTTNDSTSRLARSATRTSAQTSRLWLAVCTAHSMSDNEVAEDEGVTSGDIRSSSPLQIAAVALHLGP
jgi:hypothetical protein